MTSKTYPSHPRFELHMTCAGATCKGQLEDDAHSDFALVTNLPPGQNSPEFYTGDARRQDINNQHKEQLA